MRFGFILILSLLTITTANAESWQCRNDLEISCSNGKCEAKNANDFTPMSVSFDELGKMSVCAYTGCWEGIGKIFKNNSFLMLTGDNLKFSTATSADMNENIAITLDRKDNVATLKVGAFAQPLICKKSNQTSDNPTFGQYKVMVSKARPKPIVFRNNENARMFRTRLNQARNSGVNFAGHFIFASWGCGTSCLQGAIINTKNGVVYFPKELGVMTFGLLDDDDEPLQYQKDSKLFILNGTAGDSEDNENGTYYFVWQGTKFKKVKFVKGKDNSQFD